MKYSSETKRTRKNLERIQSKFSNQSFKLMCFSLLIFFTYYFGLVFLSILHVSSPSINFRFTRRETLHLGSAFPKRSIQPTPTKTKVWMDYRVKEDSLNEDSISSPKISTTELSENADDHENEENIDPKSTEDGQGGFKEPVVEKEMEAKPSPRVLVKPRESWVKSVVSKDSVDSKESTSSPEKQTVFPSMKNQNVDNIPVKPSPRKINEEKAKALANLSPSGSLLKIYLLLRNCNVII